MAAFVKSLHRLYSHSISMTSPVTTVRLVSRISFSPPLSSRSLQTSAAPAPAGYKQLRRPSSLSPESSESDENDDDEYGFSPNPWLKSGRLKPCALKEEDEVVKAIADLPGIGREDIKLWIDSSTIRFEAIEKKKNDAGEDAAAAEDEPRNYSGTIGFPDGGANYKLDKATAEMKNGVLEVVIPKITLEERKDVKFISVI